MRTVGRPGSRGTRRRRGARAAIAAASISVATCSVFVSFGAAQATAEGGFESAPITYEAVASAEGVRYSLRSPNYLIVDTLADVGMPVAQASLAVGASHAMAAMPYPGALVMDGPGLINFLTGLPAPPGYPLIVNTDALSVPEDDIRQPGYHIGGNSTDVRSYAESEAGVSDNQAGFGSVRATALTEYDPVENTVTALSESENGMIVLGDILRIGTVSSGARAVAGPDGAVTTESDLRIDGLSVAGLPIGFGPDGLSLPGASVPLPDLSPVASTLAQAGIEMNYLDPVVMDDGIISAGLEITVTQTVPQAEVPVLTKFTFGRTQARVQAQSLGGLVPISPDPTMSSPLVPQSSGLDLSLAPPAGGPVTFPSVESPSLPALQPPSSSQVEPILRAQLPQPSLGGFYPILILAGVLTIGSTLVVRKIGVRLAWTS